MNDIFEFRRFGLLFKKTILERYVQYAGLTALAFAVTLIIYSGVLFFTNGMARNLAQNLSFVWGIIGGGCFLASLVFGYFNTNASGAAYLTLPVSAFEKWCCGMLIICIIVPALFLVFYRLMDSCFVIAYHNGLNKNDPRYKEMYDAVQIYPFDNNFAREAIMIYTNFVSAMMLGALYFNKANTIKTALFCVCILGLLYVINLMVAKILFLNVDGAFPFANVFIKVGNDVGVLGLPDVIANFLQIAIQFIIPSILFLTVFIRLREKEI
jgi:hypothetical protein